MDNPDLRKRLPLDRKSITHKFVIHAKDGIIEGYVTVGLYDDGTPGEMFLILAKTGEALRGMARCWAICFSLCLQYRVPLNNLIERFKFFRFEPSGMTENEDLRTAQSIADYVCRWLEQQFDKKPLVS